MMKADFIVKINNKDVILDLDSKTVFVGTDERGFTINKMSSKPDMFRVLNILSQIKMVETK